MSGVRAGLRRVAVLLAVASAAVLSGWPQVQPAVAHSALVASQPPADGLVEVMPSRAYLTFSAPVSEVKEIAVIGPEGSVTNGEATFDGAEVVQTLWAGPAGDYTMSYFVVSEDGHDVRGDLHFEVGALAVLEPGTSTDPDPSSAPAPVRSADEPEEDGPGIAVPAALLVGSAAVALVLGRRRSLRSGSARSR